MLVVAVALLLLQSSSAVPCGRCAGDPQTTDARKIVVKQDLLTNRESPSSRTEKRSETAKLQKEHDSPSPQLGSIGDGVDLAAPISPMIRPAVPPSSAPLPVVIAPSAREQNRHRFTDRANLVGFGVHAAVRIADATQSCVLLGRPGRKEAWLPMKSCGSITAYSLSMVPAQVTSSYLFHRTGHHKLERWIPYMWAAPSAVGIGVSVRSW